MFVNCKFFRNGQLSGRAYTYRIDEKIVESVNVGTALMAGNSTVVVTEVNVPEENIKFSLDKVKVLDTLAEVKEPEVKGFQISEPECFKPNEYAYPLCNGNGKEECKTCCLGEELEPDLEQ